MKKIVIDYVAWEDRGWKVAFFLLPVLGLLAVVMGWRGVRELRERANWPSVPAEVTDSRLLELIEKGKKLYEPHLSYRYFIDDEQYDSSRVGWNAADYRFASKIRAEEIVFAHPVNSEVAARVNPEIPSDAYLFSQPDSSGYWLLGIGAVLLTIFILTEIHFHTRHETPDISMHLEKV